MDEIERSFYRNPHDWQGSIDRLMNLARSTGNPIVMIESLREAAYRQKLQDERDARLNRRYPLE